MSSFNIRGIVAAIMFLFPCSASAEQTLFVDFKNARLLHYYGNNQDPDVYPIVLPRSNVQRQMLLSKPIHGKFTQADYMPTWWPTANMRRRDASLPKEIRYGQPRHPIGIYRLRIAWQNPVNPSFWDAIRIHGGAREDDLYLDKSSGCIRMRDDDIVRMVNIIHRFSGEVRVTFMPAQFM